MALPGSRVAVERREVWSATISGWELTVTLDPTSRSLVLVVAWTALSLTASAVLIVRLERLGARLGLTEGALGLVAALAADAPEITAAATALSRGQHEVGVGVVLGSNVFNLAALLGLSAVVAGRVAFVRPVVVVEGAVGVWLAAVCLGVVVGPVPPGAGVVAASIVFVPYVVVIALPEIRRARLPIPDRVRRVLLVGVDQAERDLARPEHDIEAVGGEPDGYARDAVQALLAVVVVVVASVQLETTVTDLGQRRGWSSAVIGAVVLAAITSLPNAVAAVYLARRGRGAATLSEAMNSNNINALLGFLLPATLIGLGADSVVNDTVAIWYAGLTAATVAVSYWLRGIPRAAGLAIIVAYAVFVIRI
jgi:cation:H+ antiporter